jgi:colicin import membrane protein
MTPRTLNSGKEPGFSNMIFLSLIIHLAVITVVFVSIPTTSRRLTFGPVYSVQLVSSEMVLAKNSESSLMKEIEKSNEAAGSVIYKRQVTGLAPTPVKKEETNRLNIEKAVSAIKQKQVNEPVPSATAAAKPNPAGSAARTPQNEFNSWLKEYSAHTKLRITKNFNIPPALAPKENIEAIIAIKILRDGTLDYTGFEKKSGNRYFDDAAVKAIKKSTPFPPFPEGIREGSIEIGIIFHPSQLR